MVRTAPEWMSFKYTDLDRAVRMNKQARNLNHYVFAFPQLYNPRTWYLCQVGLNRPLALLTTEEIIPKADSLYVGEYSNYLKFRPEQSYSSMLQYETPYSFSLHMNVDPSDIIFVDYMNIMHNVEYKTKSDVPGDNAYEQALWMKKQIPSWGKYTIPKWKGGK